MIYSKKQTKIKLFFIILLFYILFNYLKIKNKYNKYNITLVTALYHIKSKYKFINYFNWVKNLLQINTSIVFFIDKKLSKEIKKYRPEIYKNKTVWIETNIKDLYSFKKFIKNFIKAHSIDYEKKIHSVLLYMIWAEKCYFLKRAINLNYFKSECFYWIDAGFFRKKNKINKYLNNWPSSKKCFEDSRVIINSVRNLTKLEINGLKNFNINIYNKFRKKRNVGGGFFGGNYIFIEIYFIVL